MCAVFLTHRQYKSGMNGFVDATEFGNRLGEFRRAVTNLEHSHDRGCLYDSQLKRASQAQQIVPMLRNENLG
jgi:hypothetical protein